jgi:hypothetical protein
VTTDGKSAVFKWCKHCRRWRSGPKAHLTDQHRKKAAAGQSGNTLQDASGGVNFGLFAAESDTAPASFDPDFVTTFFASHSVDPTISSEGATLSPDSVLQYSKAFQDEYSVLENHPTLFECPPNVSLPKGTGDSPPDWPFSVPRALADHLRASTARLLASPGDDALPSDDAVDPKATAGQW